MNCPAVFHPGSSARPASDPDSFAKKRQVHEIQPTQWSTFLLYWKSQGGNGPELLEQPWACSSSWCTRARLLALTAVLAELGLDIKDYVHYGTVYATNLLELYNWQECWNFILNLLQYQQLMPSTSISNWFTLLRTCLCGSMRTSLMLLLSLVKYL